MTQDELKSRLHYNPETGIFTWLENPCAPKNWNSRYPGTQAGTPHKHGHISIIVGGERLYAHRAAFLYVYGYFPEEVDHIDGNPRNNRITNLRAADRDINMKNLSRNSANTSGKTGLCWDKSRGKWIVYINVGGKRLHNKRFSDRDEAEKQRDEWSQRYGFHANHGR